MENLGEQVENREQQIQQLARREDMSAVEEEEMRLKEADTQLQALKAENKQLRVSLKDVQPDICLYCMQIQHSPLSGLIQQTTNCNSASRLATLCNLCASDTSISC